MNFRLNPTKQQCETIREVAKTISQNTIPAGQKVAVVEKSWYDDFMRFAANAGTNVKAPGPVRGYSLTSNRYGNRSARQDYEILDMDSYHKLVKVLGQHGKAIERSYIPGNNEKKGRVIVHPKEFRYRVGTQYETASIDASWTVGEIRNFICTSTNRNPSEWCFVGIGSRPVDENMRGDAAFLRYQNFVLKKRENVQPVTSTRPTPKLTKPTIMAGGAQSPVARRLLASCGGGHETKLTTPKCTFSENPTNNVQEDPEPTPEPSFHRLVASMPPKDTSFRCATPDSSFPKAVGLMNLGNTCFFNAAVQCLARVGPLTEFVMSSAFDHEINPHNPKGANGEIARAWKEFLTDMSKGGLGARDPSNLRSAVVRKFRRFANYSQHDSQELLCSVLDGIHEDINQSSAAKGRLPPVPVDKDADSWKVHLSKNSSKIVELFHGTLFSSIECPECHYVSEVCDPFMFLSLEIPNRYSGISLADCLSSFSQCDTLDAKNKWTCEGCKRKVCATKKMGVKSCAPILIVHLKRFSAFHYSKIDTAVDYPDRLDTRTFARQPTGMYRLIGAVFHSGGLGGGHYTAAACDRSGKWYYFNDSMASAIDQSSAHKSSAYILFYERE